MRLFIAEKPSVGKAIASCLGVVRASKNFIECKNNIYVTWCFGHMLELCAPQDYMKPEVAKLPWDKQPFPVIPEQWKKKKKKGVGEQLKAIESLIKKADEIVNAGDPDREGQSLVDEVIKLYKFKGKVLRYWQSAMDQTSVKRALNEICDNSKYLKWGRAAEARSYADWLIGMNITRQVSIKQNIGCTLSVGRVQTPVLKLIVDRDFIIDNFKSLDFYNIVGTVHTQSGDFKAKLVLTDEILQGKEQLTDLNKANKLSALVKNHEAQISGIIINSKVEKPKLMFTLTSLSAECSKLFKFSAKKTLDIAQELYEKYKLTSYPRSSCEYLPSSQQQDVIQILSNLKVAFPQYEQAILQADAKRESKIWNDKEVGEHAHTGIVPTLQKIDQAHLKEIPPDCQKVYELIAKRYIAAFMPDHKYNEKIVSTVTDHNYMFTIKVNEPYQIGWKLLFKQEQSEQKLPDLIKGQKAYIAKTEVEAGKSKPPARFTEGSLMVAMKNIAKEIDDPEEKKLLKDDDGLGTEATRASIIETLKERNYIEAKKGKLISTELGKRILKVIPQSLLSASLTAKTEKELKKIQNGELNIQDFLKDQLKELDKFMNETENNPNGIFKCPACGSILYHNSNKNGTRFFRCSNKECYKFFTDVNGDIGDEFEPGYRQKGEHCPVCGKDQVKRFESKKIPGTHYWFCLECKTSFNDDHGKMGLKNEVEKCPKCQGKLYRNESRSYPGKFYWHCSNKGCAANFFDVDGKVGQEKIPVKPVKEAQCPSCGKNIGLYERSKKDGTPYKIWRCNNCKKTFFNYVDKKTGDDLIGNEKL